ncbi:sensory box histidine kinase/response regulator, partial [Pseudomonas savastanoi pv. glycinea str. race 4]
QANRRGVFAGLAAGIFIWFYTLVLPVAAHGMGWSLSNFPLLSWLHSNPFDLPISPMTQGVVLSMAGNCTLFAWVSMLSRTRVA